ncbi:uncharacterized protein MONBRDRAFT_10923 [Monosiga brevicollis MX1]|uniref:Uncharacterized protein n=1 Tax=Monosiga brevicollis TaxID=81824 RepID=A9V7M9_MONBE|nr:uncharacterized protein MONBRDRAFT_10923 [Monosiga brevicollis MX1]EDQ86332.1 predicted protein [Monosiga brevicollis MX1]|eukprot:XP_001748722.1 hypothetical protein [Monosiga brevicollis MX1]
MMKRGRELRLLGLGLLLLLLVMGLAVGSGDLEEAIIGTDAAGNLVINSSRVPGGGRVLVDGVDVQALQTACADLLQAQAELLAAQARLEARLRRVPLYEPQIYVVGGLNGNMSEQVYMFNGTRWWSTAALPTPRFSLAAAVLNDGLYVLGGLYYMGMDGSAPITTAAVEVLDGLVWRPVPPLPQARGRLSAVTFQNALYVIGGMMGTDRPTAVFRFDGSTWTEAAPLSFPRLDAAAVVFQDEIYLIGGRNGSVLAVTEIFNGTAWRPGPSTQVARYALTAVVFENSIYALGGHSGPNGVGVLALVEVLVGQTWQTRTPLNTARYFLAAAVLGDGLYVMGGRNQVDLASVERFNGTAWQAAPPMPSPRNGFAAVVY